MHRNDVHRFIRLAAGWLDTATDRFIPRLAGADPEAPAETVETLTLLQQLRAKRDELVNALSTSVEQRATKRGEFEKRDASTEKPTDEERSAFIAEEEAFAADFARREAEIDGLDQRVKEQEILERRRQTAADASKGDARVTSEPLTYRSDNARGTSYFRDLAIVTSPGIAARMADPAGAAERLQRHAAEMNVELPKREAAREARAQKQVDEAEQAFSGSFIDGVNRRGLEASPFERKGRGASDAFEERTTPNRTDGQGGYFVPPLWLVDEYIPALRAGRVAAGLCRQLDLPAGTDSINIPKLSTTTLTAIQTADNAAVTSQDFTDTSVSAGVKTIAGQSDVSLQLVEQSPGRIIDQVIIEDLMADYNQRLDLQVLAGTNANGQVQGILPDTSWTANKVTWTSSTPLGPMYNMALGAMASKVSYNRYSLDQLAYLMHPRRWFWFATALDGASGTSGRPIVSEGGFGPYNASALVNGNLPAEGLAGRVPFGPAAYIDGNVPVLASAAGAVTGGTNDLALAAKWDDLWLFEGALRTRVLPEVLSGTLSIRFQVYNYLAFLVRYGQSIAVTVGTGMAAPTAAGDTSITF